ncbi:MAG: N-acetylneuraminate synthase family protein [Gemmataceae bacterium]
MNTEFRFKDLFVLDLANNHNGDVQHALRIVRGVGEVVAGRKVRAALKFQFRQLDTFVHPAHKQQSPYKYPKRFIDTRLSNEEFGRLAQEVRSLGMITMATPFDEESVDVIEGMGLDVIKIASCSATDWPLLERVAEANKPVIVSTGGLSWKEIDDLVSFFDHRRVHFAIMHCVSIYPTPPELLQLNQINQLRERYPGRTIGFSTHEDPDALSPVQVALAKGAEMYERHVGLKSDTDELNGYSSTPEQIDRWIGAALSARALCGAALRLPPLEAEVKSLDGLKRGVYANKDLEEGVNVERGDVYFAMPCEPGQLTSGEYGQNIFDQGIATVTSIKKDGPLLREQLKLPADLDKQVLYTAIHEMKSMLNEARVALPADFETEFSHHYGFAEFPKVGATMITVVNRIYCKKIIIQTPGQRHPCHYHKKKEETFYVLWGVLEMIIDGRRRTLYPGDTVLVQQGVWHEFWTDTGVIFDELSTTDLAGDSFYEDKRINKMKKEERKTRVNHWGVSQI